MVADEYFATNIRKNELEGKNQTTLAETLGPKKDPDWDGCRLWTPYCLCFLSPQAFV